MDLLIASNTVDEASRDEAPAAGTPGWATDGNPAKGIPATIFPAYHYNMVMGELRNLVTESGLTPDGSDWTQIAQAIKKLCGSGRLLNARLVTSSTSYSPSAGTELLRVRMVGAGGASGGSVGQTIDSTMASCGGCGASGGYLEFFLKVAGFSWPQTLSIGAGGVGAYAGKGSPGGTTSFGSIASCEGGEAGNTIALNGGASGWAGQASGGSVKLLTSDYIEPILGFVGENGQSPFIIPNFSVKNGSVVSGVGLPIPLIGPSSPLGTGGGNGINTTSTVPTQPSQVGARGSYGAGGGGTGSTGAGGNFGTTGAPGAIIIEEYS